MLLPFKKLIKSGSLPWAALLLFSLQADESPAHVIEVVKYPRPYVHFKNQDPNNYLKRSRVPVQLSMGELLFRSPYILGAAGKKLGMSCDSCHPNGDRNKDFFLVGNSEAPGTIDLTHHLVNPGRDNKVPDALRIPSLRGVRYLAPYGHQGKFNSLRDFNRNLVNHVFDGRPLDDYLLDSLTAYLKELEFLPNQNLNQHNDLVAKAGTQALHGEKLFKQGQQGTQACQGCHIPTAFFRDGRIHRLGSRSYAETSPFSFEGGVKTPTLLGHDLQSFFHRGDVKKLEDVLLLKEESLGYKFSPAQKKSLLAYTRAIAQHEKPLDERHIAERLVETISLLRVFEKQEIAGKYSPLVLQTVHHILGLQAAHLNDEASKKILENTRIDLLMLVNKKDTGFIAKKALEIERHAQEAFRYLK